MKKVKLKPERTQSKSKKANMIILISLSKNKQTHTCTHAIILHQANINETCTILHTHKKSICTQNRNVKAKTGAGWDAGGCVCWPASRHSSGHLAWTTGVKSSRVSALCRTVETRSSQISSLSYSFTTHTQCKHILGKAHMNKCMEHDGEICRGWRWESERDERRLCGGETKGQDDDMERSMKVEKLRWESREGERKMVRKERGRKSLERSTTGQISVTPKSSLLKGEERGAGRRGSCAM